MWRPSRSGWESTSTDVRFVAHLDLPKSLEAYYQETGRAGRDGLPANAWMAYGLQDVILLRRMLAESGADDSQKRIEHQKLESLLGYCENHHVQKTDPPGLTSATS